MVVASTAWYEVVGALGAAVGGLGAAVGAVAAWRAAAASRATSRDALDALALAIAPTLGAEFAVSPQTDESGVGRWTARIFNGSSQFAATDVAFEAIFRDGHAVRDTTERIAPSEDREILLRETALPPGGPSLDEAGETAVIRYSDERNIARYEQRYSFLSRKLGDGTRLPTGGAIATSEPLRVS